METAMIKLFRHIRLSLVNEGKTTRYFKYAFGEIILVVIGILIALQVNNWNNARLNKKKEFVLVYQLLQDAAADSLFINTRIQLFKAQIKNYKNLQALCTGTISDSLLNSYLSEKNITTPFITAASQSNVVNNNTNTYEILSDFEIKKHLRDYQAKYEYFNVAIQLYNESAESSFASIALRNYETTLLMAKDSVKISSLKPLCDDKDIKGIALLLEGKADNALQQTVVLWNHCNTLLTASRTYLNANK
jgi:Family of unknown function (DUF6090)